MPIETYMSQAELIVVGTVGQGEPEVLTGRSFYRDWELDVELYLTDALPYETIVVRTFTGATDAAGDRMPVKMPDLAHGERVLLFLNKNWDNPPLASHEYVMPDPLGGKFRIVDGDVRVRYADEEAVSIRSLSGTVSRITDRIAACNGVGPAVRSR